MSASSFTALSRYERMSVVGRSKAIKGNTYVVGRLLATQIIQFLRFLYNMLVVDTRKDQDVPLRPVQSIPQHGPSSLRSRFPHS